jgi:hypothetical protein
VKRDQAGANAAQSAREQHAGRVVARAEGDRAADKRLACQGDDEREELHAGGALDGLELEWEAVGHDLYGGADAGGPAQAESDGVLPQDAWRDGGGFTEDYLHYSEGDEERKGECLYRLTPSPAMKIEV